MSNWWKTLAKTLIVWPHQRVEPDHAWQIDMVADQHKIAWTIVRIDPTCGIAHDERLRPQQMHNPHRQGQRLRAIAFIKMKAPLHHNHRHLFQQADEQTSSMTSYCRVRKVGDLLIRNRHRFFYQRCQITQARAKNDRHCGPHVCMLLNCCYRLNGLIVEHKISSY